MRTVLNFLWFVFFGIWWFILYALLGVVFCITIIGIPIGISLFQFAKMMALPFGKEIVRTRDIKDVHIALNVGARIANFIWFPIGLICAIINIILGIACCITIIGIPCGIIVYFRCAKFILFPIGARVVTKEEAIIKKTTQNIRQEIRNQNNSASIPPDTQNTSSENKEEKRKMQEQRRLERHEAMQKNKENAIKAFNKAKETCIPIKNEAVRKSKKFIKWFKGKLEESKKFRVTVISVCAAVILAITVLTLIFKAATIFVSLAVILAIIILALIFSNF